MTWDSLMKEGSNYQVHSKKMTTQVYSRAKGKTISDLSSVGSPSLEQEFGFGIKPELRSRASLTRTFTIDKRDLTINPPLPRFGHSLIQKPTPTLRPQLHSAKSFAGSTSQDLSQERIARCRTRKMLARPPSFQTMHQLCEIEHQFVKSKPLLVAKRQLLFQGTMIKETLRNNKLPSKLSRHFFLFTDVLVYGTILSESQLPNSWGKHFDRQIFVSLGHCFVEKDPENLTALFITTEKEYFRVVCSSVSQASAWQSQLTSAIEAYRNRPRNVPSDTTRSSVTGFFRTLSLPSSPSLSLRNWSLSRRPSAVSITDSTIWVPDQDAPSCMVCKTTRFSVLVRRHHCRSCGYVICHRCSVNTGSFLKSRTRLCLPCSESSHSPLNTITEQKVVQELDSLPGSIIPSINVLLSDSQLTTPSSPLSLSDTGSSIIDSNGSFSYVSPNFSSSPLTPLVPSKLSLPL